MPGNGLGAGKHRRGGTFLTAASEAMENAAARAYENAFSPVSAWPRIRVWISLVPS